MFTETHSLIISEISQVTTTIFTEMSFFFFFLGVNYVQTAGIIIEYNPMHSGHLYLLEQVRARLGADTAVICAMSGNFVQRGDFALLRKHQRARAAVESGVDLVLTRLPREHIYLAEGEEKNYLLKLCFTEKQEKERS